MIKGQQEFFKDLDKKLWSTADKRKLNRLKTGAIFDEIFSDLMEIEHLRKLRGMILPKLYSGEVGV